MRKYILDLRSREWKADASFDTSSFMNIELQQIADEILESRLDPLFAITVGGSIYNTPLVHEGIVYFGCCDQKFYALSTSGGLLWSFETQGVIVSSPCMVGNLLVFGCYDYNLYALERKTGRLSWKFPTGDKIYSDPCTDGSLIFFCSKDGNAYCVNARGELVWKFRTGGMIESHPLLYKGTLYFGSNDRNFYAVEPGTGKLLWKFLAKSGVRLGPVAWKGVIYFVTFDREVCGVTDKGKQVFSFMMNDFSSGSLAAGNDLIYIPSRDRNMYAVRPDGSLAWKFGTGHAVEKAFVNRNLVLFGGEDHNLYAVEAATGKLTWKFTGNGFMPSTPVTVDGVVYMGGWDCNMYALDFSTGKLIWKFRTSIGTQSGFDMEAIRPEKHFEVVWLPENESSEQKEEEKNLGDYGESENLYATGMSKDYVKSKKGYI